MRSHTDPGLDDANGDGHLRELVAVRIRGRNPRSETRRAGKLELEVKARADIERAVDPQLAAHAAHQLAADREAEPGTRERDALSLPRGAERVAEH